MTTAFPKLRWALAAWMLVWLPAYGHTWGAANFLLLCDTTMILAFVGVWLGSSLLLSSQAVGSLLAGLLWALDIGWRLTTGAHLFGGTEYMWDARFPLWVRLLSLFHLLLPLLLVWTLRRVGYDRRGWLLQAALTLPLIAAGRWADPVKNANFAFADPLFHRAWGPAPLHVLVIFVAIVAIIYWPTHLVLGRLCPERSIETNR